MTLKRFLVAVLACVVLGYGALVVAGPQVELPVALVCDRGTCEERGAVLDGQRRILRRAPRRTVRDVRPQEQTNACRQRGLTPERCY
jgi:hypothetical protein